MPFAQSFYYPIDRQMDNDSTVTESTISEDMPTAIEFEQPPVIQKPPMPVFSSYIQPGMATPAYNTLTAPRPESVTVPEMAAPAVAAPPPVPMAKPTAVKELSQEPPSHYSWPEEISKKEYQLSKEYKYKESIYMGFKNDVALVHNRGSQHTAADKHVSFESEKPKEMAEKVKETAKPAASRLVKSIKISEPPMVQPQPSQEYSAVEGDAFKPVITAASEYHFGQLNDLLSYIDIKQ